ncbi:MAG: protoglobin family protein [Planctomycetaceae bacterium]
MQTIDESRLETDPLYRYEFLAGFIGFDVADVKLIQASAQHLGPRIPEMVNETYRRLLAYEATARHFVPRNQGFEGDPPVDVKGLSVDHPQIKFRKDHLNRYFIALIGRAYDAKMVQYLDMVGRIHTPHAGNKAISVPLVQMNALMGVISNVLLTSISTWTLPEPTRMQTIQAFNKLLWIQNDFITRHYAQPLWESE